VIISCKSTAAKTRSENEQLNQAGAEPALSAAERVLVNIEGSSQRRWAHLTKVFLQGNYLAGTASCRPTKRAAEREHEANLPDEIVGVAVVPAVKSLASARVG